MIEPGQRLLHYRIEDKLGQGGMGEVYRARDTRLDRDVALKVLSGKLAGNPTSLQRFRLEAQAVAAINHPNIVTIHAVEQDGDTHFLTMELVRGRSLDRLVERGGLPIDRLLQLALPIADGLAAAHERGITHRDLKPANIMLGDDGRVRILDFGLAKLEQAATGAEDRTRTTPLTFEGAIVGTIPYMSPEQVEGKPLDPRTDIFSLGVLLYELATGDRPFRGGTQPALMSSILRDVPPQIVALRADLPRHLGRIVQRCLEKEPQSRYRSATDVAYELRALKREHEASGPVASSAAAPRPQPSTAGSGLVDRGSTSGDHVGQSIAVLPFVNRSAKEDDQYFSDGLSEELINALSKIAGIKVTARSSAFQFRGQELDVRDVGRKLGVEAVLEGSVRIAGSRLRITTELVNCADGLQLWSGRFDGEMKDVFDTQDEIVQKIVEQLEIKVGSSQGDRPLVKRETDNLDAYHLLLKARQHMGDFWEPGLVQAIECLERAVELDPGYAQAYADMSFCWLVRSIFGTLSGKEGFPHVRETARRALELDPDLGDAHAMHGIYLAWHDFDWVGAEVALRRAVHLNPQGVWGHFFYAGMLSTARRGDDILPHVRMMRELDPLNRVVNAHVALFLFYAGRIDEAIEAAGQSIELFPDFWFPYYELSYFLWQKRDEAGALENMRKAIEMTGDNIPFLSCILAAMEFSFGHDDEGERVLARVDEQAKTAPVAAMGRIVVEVVRGDTDAAIDWLERGRADHDMLLCWTRAFCELQGIIRDDRIRDAMARVGLP